LQYNKSKATKDGLVNKKVLLISDLHCPYNHVDSYRFLKAIKEKLNPDRVICLGDEIDGASFSFHDKDPDLPFSPSAELEKSIECLSSFYKLFPKMDILESNHGSLIYRKGKHHGIPRHVFKSYRDILEAPKGWHWHLDLKIRTPSGECYFTHGKSSNGKKLGQNMAMNCVQGHHHSTFDIQYFSTPNGLYWSMIIGCLINDRSLAFAYNKSTLARPIIGTGCIINGQPRLIPMVLNKKGRWDGVLHL
jgi:hypothetical protein